MKKVSPREDKRFAMVKPLIAVKCLRDHLGNFILISVEVTKSTVEVFKTLVSQSDPEQQGPGLMKIPLMM